MRRYPIGIQTFDDVINGGYVYVDKTRYVWDLVNGGKYYFLSRPRRFGKSLFLSTLEAFFRGRRELFRGLAIDSCDYDWQKYPVLHLDLNSKDYTSDDGALERMLDQALGIWEAQLGIAPREKDVELRFADVIRTACETSGRQVAVLIDEYDKPLLANLFNPERHDRFRSMLKAFYGVLKSCDRYVKFGFLTGVTKFGKVSVFSDLNNLRDITLLSQFNAICGISESELRSDFKEDIITLSQARNLSVGETLEKLKANYDGYHFTDEPSEGIYNPFSLLNTLASRRFDDYWFATGTPTMLVELLMKSDTDLSGLGNVERSGLDLMGIDPVFRDPIPVIFQSGYLTIKGYDERRRRYRLGFPNEEVERGFLEALLPAYVGRKVSKEDADIFRLIDALEAGDVDLFMNILRSFMAGIPYSDDSARIPERRFSDIIFIVSSLIGLNVETERQTNRGRIDLLIKTERYIYVIEFKVDATPDSALAQIEEKGYALPFLTDGRRIFKVGAEFSTIERNISGWKAVECSR